MDCQVQLLLGWFLFGWFGTDGFGAASGLRLDGLRRIDAVAAPFPVHLRTAQDQVGGVQVETGGDDTAKRQGEEVEPIHALAVLLGQLIPEDKHQELQGQKLGQNNQSLGAFAGSHIADTPHNSR